MAEKKFGLRYVLSRLQKSEQRYFWWAILAFFLIFLVFLVVFFQKKQSSIPQPIAQQPESYYQTGSSTVFSDDFENITLNSGWIIMPANMSSNVKPGSTPTTPSDSGKSLELNITSQAIALTKKIIPGQYGNKISILFYDDKSLVSGRYVAVTNDKYNIDNPNAKIITIGAYPTKNGSNYWARVGFNTGTNYDIDTHISRSVGWHRVDLNITPFGTYAELDGINLTYLPFLPGLGVKANPLYFPTDYKMTDFSQIVLTAYGAAHKSYFDAVKIWDILPPTDVIADRELEYADQFVNMPEDKINPVTFARINSNKALTYAAHNRYSDVERTIRLIIDDSDLKISSDRLWKDNSGHAVPAYTTGLTAWLSWDYIPDDLKILLKIRLTDLANYLLTQKPDNSFVSDSAAESNAWNAGFLALVSQMFPDEPSMIDRSQSQKWENAGKLWAHHTFTADKLDTWGGVSTQTLWSDFHMDNHGIHENQSYVLCAIEGLAKGALAYRIRGQSVPSEFTHNVQEVWDVLQPYLNWNTYQYKYAGNQINNKTGNLMSSDFDGKDEYNMDMTYFNDALAYISILGLNNVPDMDKLTKFGYYIKDFPAFPYRNYPSISAVGSNNIWISSNVVNGHSYVWPNPNNTYTGVYLLNAIAAKRHLLSYYLQNTPQLNPVVMPSTPPPIPFYESFELDSDFSQAWTFTPLGVNKVELSLNCPVPADGKCLHISLNNKDSAVTLSHQFPSAQQGTFTAKFYDDNTINNGLYIALTDNNYPATTSNMAMVGVRPSLIPTTYWSRYGANSSSNNTNTGIVRSPKWHTLKFIVDSTGTTTYIDDQRVGFYTTVKNFTRIVLVSAYPPTHQSFIDSISFIPN